MSGRQVKQHTKLPAEVGIDGAVLTAEQTSNDIDVNGFAQMTLLVNHSTNADATTITIAPDISVDGGTTWYPLQTQSVSAGVATLSDLVITKAVSGADTFVYDIPINYDLMRLRVSGAGISGSSTDVVSVTVRLGTN